MLLLPSAFVFTNLMSDLMTNEVYLRGVAFLDVVSKMFSVTNGVVHRRWFEIVCVVAEEGAWVLRGNWFASE